MDETNHEGLVISALSRLHLGPIDWQINRGECVSLAGVSGSGKSLLLRALADLDPYRGELRLDGMRADAMPGHLWRRRVGLLPAEPHWWSAQVGEHFSVDAKTEDLLASVGLPAQALQWEVSRCSTGERQRLALARLLQNRPEVLLLDEPTAALDTGRIGEVESLLADYRHRYRAAVVWVSHDAAQRERVAQRHFALSDGRLQEWVR